MRRTLLVSMLLLLTLAGCSLTKERPVPVFVQPKKVQPPAELMQRHQPNFLCRMQDFLSGKPIEQIESQCSSTDLLTSSSEPARPQM